MANGGKAYAGKQNIPGKQRKPRAKAPEGETKEQKFIRLGTGRVSAAIKAINSVGKLAAPSYSYTEAHVEALVLAIDKASQDMEDRLRARLNGGSVVKAAGFKFG